MSAPVEPQPGPDFAKAIESLCRIQQRDKDYVDSGDLAQVCSILDLCEAALLRAAETEKQLREEIEDWRNREAAVCPEDFGCEETIRALRASLARAEQDTARMEKAIRWALGVEGDFRLRAPADGPFWWRTELHRRTFGARAIDAARAGASPPTTDAARLAAPQDQQEGTTP